ncbi:DNA repair protein RecN [Lachnospiraceae bacterium C1.1]|nr:DNA repair protein RecN [Lachnospiraceae bacterium C1.1]
MLVSLQVKNLALIDESQIFLSNGLNIFSGETGAGKSLVIGSVSLGLGGKAAKDVERDKNKPAEIELVFTVESEEEKAKLKEMEIPIDDDNILVIKRRIKDGRGITKVNGETVNSSELKELSSLFIDIHGQHEHQSLLYQKNHLKILDRYAGDEFAKAFAVYSEHYANYRKLNEEFDSVNTDEAARIREADLLRYEIEEIEEASLKDGEDEELEKKFHLMNNSKKIAESVGGAFELLGGDEAAGEMIGRAVRLVQEISSDDERAGSLYDELVSIDALVSDFRKDAENYLREIEFSEEDFNNVTSRLDKINQLKSKYGQSLELIYDALSDRKERLEKIENFDAYIEELKNKIKEEEKSLDKAAAALTSFRQHAATELGWKLQKALVDLNFPDVKFTIDVRESDVYTVNGRDEVEFMLSSNPGEPLRPLKNIASGGELSRVMLALKTVLADTDSIDTLIFDEIDTGISGRTAQKVSECLSRLAKRHQVICITHLPQIAAMADHHFLIQKNVIDERTVTEIRELDDEEITDELSRIIGGAVVTDTVRQSAEEMKRLADDFKKHD